MVYLRLHLSYISNTDLAPKSCSVALKFEIICASVISVINCLKKMEHSHEGIKKKGHVDEVKKA